MKAITVKDRDAGVGGLSLTDMPYPHAAENDVIVRVHAAGFTPGELDWPARSAHVVASGRAGSLVPRPGAGQRRGSPSGMRTPISRRSLVRGLNPNRLRANLAARGHQGLGRGQSSRHFQRGPYGISNKWVGLRTSRRRAEVVFKSN